MRFRDDFLSFLILVVFSFGSQLQSLFKKPIDMKCALIISYKELNAINHTKARQGLCNYVLPIFSVTNSYTN